MDPLASYQAFTAAAVGLTGSDKLAHVHAGLAIYVGARAVGRGRHASLVALGMVLLPALMNEVLDRLFWGTWRWRDTVGDLVATMFWPTVLWWVARGRRARRQGRPLRQQRTARHSLQTGLRLA